jgi:hypothetical protein
MLNYLFDGHQFSKGSDLMKQFKEIVENDRNFEQIDENSDTKLVTLSDNPIKSKIVCYFPNLEKFVNKKSFEYHFRKFQTKWIPKTFLIYKRKFIGKHCPSKKTLKNEKLWYIKPPKNYGGKGIIITRFIKSSIKKLPFKQLFVAQAGVTDLMTINKKKFDIRIFVLVLRKSRNEPLNIYLYNDAILRICSKNFKKFGTDIKSQITNYHLHTNKKNYEEDKVKYLDKLSNYKKFYMRSYIQLKNILKDMFPKLNKVCAIPKFRNKPTFWLMGMDAILDTSYKLWVVEINKNPALCFDYPGKISICKDVSYDILYNFVIPLSKKMEIRKETRFSKIKMK